MSDERIKPDEWYAQPAPDGERQHVRYCDEYHQHRAPDCCDSTCWCRTALDGERVAEYERLRTLYRASIRNAMRYRNPSSDPDIVEANLDAFILPLLSAPQPVAATPAKPDAIVRCPSCGTEGWEWIHCSRCWSRRLAKADVAKPDALREALETIRAWTRRDCAANEALRDRIHEKAQVALATEGDHV